MLPTECAEIIVQYLSPKQRFIIATDIRLLFIQRQTLPLVTYSFEYANALGRIDILDAYRTTGWIQQHAPFSEAYMDAASIAGRTRVLEWWKRQHDELGIELKYSKLAIDNVTLNIPCITVLYDRNGKRRYPIHLTCGVVGETDHPEKLVACKRITKVLDWWKNSGLPLIYTETTMDMASMQGHVGVLEWWKQSGLECKYSHKTMQSVRRHVHSNVLEWWKGAALPHRGPDVEDVGA